MGMRSGGGMYRLGVAGLVGVLGLGLSACDSGRIEDAVQQGVVVAPTRAPTRDEAIRLDGEWWFWPRSAENPVLQKVPAVWDALQPGRSSGIYKLTITGLQAGELYALRFKGLNSRAEISIDTRTIGIWGASGMSYVPRSFWFTPGQSTAELTVAVENSVQASGGLWMPVWLGSPDAIDRVTIVARFSDVLVFGAILMMALYHLALYVMRREERSTLYFSLFCILTVIKSGLSGEQVLAVVIPALGGTAGMRIAYLAVILMPITFLAYVSTVFPRKSLKYSLVGFGALGTVQSAISVIAPVHIIQSWFLPYQIIVMAACLYLIFILIQEVRQHTSGSRLMLTGLAVLVAATGNDVLYDQKLISTFYSLGFGLFLFLFIQAVIMGRVFTRSFNEARDLNANLELRVAERTRELEQLSRIDALTNLTNRRHFWVLLEQEWERWIRYKQDFCLVMVDLDHFKELNDTLGHAAGDEALRNIASRLQANVRKTDICSRYGGEEFCLILPGTGVLEATSLMEKIRFLVASEPLVTHPVATLKTLSYGIAQASHHLSPAELLEASDKLMYQAKEVGRNRGFSEAE